MCQMQPGMQWRFALAIAFSLNKRFLKAQKRDMGPFNPIVLRASDWIPNSYCGPTPGRPQNPVDPVDPVQFKKSKSNPIPKSI
jgi:hypothetical protein